MSLRRAAHEKSRNGCLTCKIRRVKCDETVPSCRKCTETGRKCEGPVTNELQFRFIDGEPEPRSKRLFSAISKFEQQCHVDRRQTRGRHCAPLATSVTQIRVLSPEISLLRPQHSGVERHAFDHFVRRAAPIFAGAVEEGFWTVVVPCLAQSDPFVWDTVVSISWLFEYVPYEMTVTTYEANDTPRVTSIEHRRALKWYNRALANLRQRIDRNEMDGPFALLSCVLCLCVELQQRNVGNSLRLLQSGNKIFSQALFSKNKSTPTKNLALDRIVMPFLSRRAELVATMVIPLSDWIENGATKDSLGPFRLSSANPLAEFRSDLYNVMFQAYEIIRVGVLMWHDEEIMQILAPRQQIALDELERWHISFIEHWSSTAEPLETKSNETLWIYSHLIMSWHVCYIWLSTCTTGYQMAFDEHMAHFAELLLHAQHILDLESGSVNIDHMQDTNFETGLISALYYAAAHCRNPVLRRKALQLSRRAPRHESLWANVFMAQAIEHVMALEEDEPYVELDLTDPVVLAELRARPLPPEERRIQHIAILGQKTTATGHTLAVQLGRIAVDADGLRRTVHEDVLLEHCASARLES